MQGKRKGVRIMREELMDQLCIIAVHIERLKFHIAGPATMDSLRTRFNVIRELLNTLEQDCVKDRNSD